MDAHANLRSFLATCAARQDCTRMCALTRGIPWPLLQHDNILHTHAHANLRNFLATFKEQ